MIPAWLSRLFAPPAPAPYQWPDVEDEHHRLTLLDLARKFLHVRELAGNQGARVEAIQRWCGGVRGQPWCAYYVTLVLDLHYGGKAPVPREGNCDVILALARDKQWVVPDHDMKPGDLYLRLADPTNAVHVGFTTTPMRAVDGKRVFGQLSGNTSKNGLSSNGDGVYERDIPYPGAEKMVFVRLPSPLTTRRNP